MIFLEKFLVKIIKVNSLEPSLMKSIRDTKESQIFFNL